MVVGMTEYPHLRTERPKEQLIKSIDLSLFRHSVYGRVRSHEVDRLGIVHNAVYLYWLENARIEYWRECGLPIDQQTFVTKHRFVLAHLDIDYLWAARFDEEYWVLTRTTFIKNSSFGVEQIIKSADENFYVVANAILVNLNPATWRPQRVSDAFRTLIREYEGEVLQILS